MHCMNCKEDVMPRDGGLNSNGIILLVITILFCLPLCWLPFVLSGCKNKSCPRCGAPMA